IAVTQRRKFHAESIVLMRSLGICLTQTILRSQMRRRNHHRRLHIAIVVGHKWIKPRQSSAGPEKQRPILFLKKSARAQIIPDQSIRTRKSQRASVVRKLRQSMLAAGPNISLMVRAKHINLEPRQSLCDSKMRHLRLAIHDLQPANSQRIAVMKP